LLTNNGDPIADFLYSVNWLPIGFMQAYFVNSGTDFAIVHNKDLPESLPDGLYYAARQRPTFASAMCRRKDNSSSAGS